MPESFKEVADFAFRQAQVRGVGDAPDFNDYYIAAQHLNGVLSQWSNEALAVPGYSLKAFRVPHEAGTFTMGVNNADLPTGSDVTTVLSVWYRGQYSTQWQVGTAGVQDILPNFSAVTAGTFTNSQPAEVGISYERRSARLTFPVKLYTGDVLVVAYKVSLGRIDPPRWLDDGTPDLDDLQNRVLTIHFDLEDLYLDPLRYSLAERIASEYSEDPETRRSCRVYKNEAMDLVYRKQVQPGFKRVDTGLLRYGPDYGYYRDGVDSGATEDIGGVYQEDTGIILQSTSPGHPTYASGEFAWGYFTDPANIAATAVHQGTMEFRYGHAAAFQFGAAGAAGDYLYIDVPAGTRVSALLDERGHPQLTAWTVSGQYLYVGPVVSGAETDEPRYSITIVQDTE